MARMTRESCGDCPHLVSATRYDIYPPTAHFFCGHHDELELDSNGPGRWLGFIPLVTEECALLQREESDRRLDEAVARWEQETSDV